MLTAFYRTLANLLFLVSAQVQTFKKREPDAIVLAAGATKARRLSHEAKLERGVGWITAKRAALILTTTKLVCGEWEIPLSSITEATMVRVNSLFAKALVLKISTREGPHYQFGLQYDPAWEAQRALAFRVEDGKIGYSTFSVVVRLVLWLSALGFCAFWWVDMLK